MLAWHLIVQPRRCFVVTCDCAVDPHGQVDIPKPSHAVTHWPSVEICKQETRTKSCLCCCLVCTPSCVDRLTTLRADVTTFAYSRWLESAHPLVWLLVPIERAQQELVNLHIVLCAEQASRSPR